MRENSRGGAQLPSSVLFEVWSLAVAPESLRNRYTRGLRRGEAEGAAEHFERAVALRPAEFGVSPEP